ncbi:alpha/beta fold hydrolase [Nannocystis sp.]|uniref:alpha/beta hydrolase n=1 Tax=Nannocystis sp. TaxID=1962667 RepID=UPI0024279929|nr:alpha/beta fold hydrolase [Nannocystis sp.]MBK7824955.1 alpha/beta hydrolase fold domain-containing protein [Nannocystis sp.]MBK9752791.1 alpha/beta hydrolase fold domain-containing protein [Nannocystis sp.]
MTHLLPCVEAQARVPATASVIWLHGLGADGHDFEPLVPHLKLPYARFVFPNAPAIPITINGGFVMPGWYDIRNLELSPHVKDREDPAQIRRSAAAIEALLAREVGRGVPAERIVLAGFSQGGALANYVAQRHAQRLAGFMVLSAYELMIGSGGEHEANASTPALFCHGRHDPMVPMFAGQAACESARRSGREVRWYDFPIAHEVSLPEIQTIAAWLAERLPPL